jgi:hypothetical protein
MIDQLDSLSLLAELAIALAGFSGVAAAFSGRERSYGPTELIRLKGLFLTSGFVFAGSGAAYILLLADFQPTLVFRVVSSLVLVAYLIAGVPAVILGYRAARNPGSTVEKWALHLTSAHTFLMLALFGLNVYWGHPYVFIGAFWIQLTWGIFLFWRVLTRAN